MHPLLRRELHRAARVPLEEGGILKYGHIWALDGLNGGFHCSVDPDKFQASRTRMLERADKEAYNMLQEHKQRIIRDANEGNEEESERERDIDMLKEEESEGELGGAPGALWDGDVDMH